MSENKTPGSDHEEDAEENDKAESGAKQKPRGPSDSAAPADDDIIIK